VRHLLLLGLNHPITDKGRFFKNLELHVRQVVFCYDLGYLTLFHFLLYYRAPSFRFLIGILTISNFDIFSTVPKFKLESDKNGDLRSWLGKRLQLACDFNFRLNFRPYILIF
jgi:hypothetical protein